LLTILAVRALVFEFDLKRIAWARAAGKISERAYVSSLGPLRLRHVSDPVPPGDDWAVVETALCGICGSDTKQVFIDADFDNPLESLVSFPQILGHEVVGRIVEVGPAVATRRPGERAVLSPWLPCRPRGIDPPCPACERGEYSLCANFTEGALPVGMHHGNCSAATGGFAPLFPAHESQLVPIPDGVDDEVAVLADPFSVALHAVLKAPPREGELALVIGCGTIGLLHVAALEALYPRTRVAAVARHRFQEEAARALGAEEVIRPRSQRETIEAVAALTGEKVIEPRFAGPWLRGGVAVVYDSIGSASTLETGVRVARSKAAIVITGVSRPRRFEWTPHYFKEIELVGSNAFGVEEVEGERRHAFEHYLALLESGRLAPPRLVTHRFPLEEYRDALLASHHKGRHGMIKAVFDLARTE
jgi:threonine dehydrogenase-like Zn-dependent dehydrogenase